MNCGNVILEEQYVHGQGPQIDCANCQTRFDKKISDMSVKDFEQINVCFLLWIYK